MHAVSLALRRHALPLLLKGMVACLATVTSATADQGGYPPPPGPYQSESAVLPGALPEQGVVTTNDSPSQPADDGVLPSSGIPAPLPLRSTSAGDAVRGSRLFGSANNGQTTAPPSDFTWREQNHDWPAVSPRQREEKEPGWRSTAAEDTPVRRSTPATAPSQTPGYDAYPGQSYPQAGPYPGYQPYAAPGGWGVPGYAGTGYGYAGPYPFSGYGNDLAPPANAVGRFGAAAADEGGNGESDTPVWRQSNRPANPTANDKQQRQEPPASSVLFRPRSEQPTW